MGQTLYRQLRQIFGRGFFNDIGHNEPNNYCNHCEHCFWLTSLHVGVLLLHVFLSGTCFLSL